MGFKEKKMHFRFIEKVFSELENKCTDFNLIDVLLAYNFWP